MKAKLLILLSIISISMSANASWVSAYSEWTTLGLGNQYTQSGNYVRSISESDSFFMLRRNYGHLAMKRIYAYISAADIVENNQNIIKLSKQPVNYASNANGFDPRPDALKELTKSQINILYSAMANTYVVANQRLYGGRGVGFCFGRALVAHNQALIRNVHPASVRKIWVIGNMGFWGHHVATIVKVKGTWLAVDNFTGVMNVEQWIQRMKQEKDAAATKPLMFFITRAGRFGHANNSLYNSTDLFNVPQNRMEQVASKQAKESLKRRDFYQGFFMDFYEELDTEETLVRKFSQQENIEQERVAQAQVEYLRLEAIKSEHERAEFAKLSAYKLTQSTTYCYNTLNQKVNCNYQLEMAGIPHETSVSITGFAQYQVQVQKGETIYAKHIIDPRVQDEVSYHISEDSEGKLTKIIVEYVKPSDKTQRPYYKVVESSTDSQTKMFKEVEAIKDIMFDFDPKYIVKPQNASPKGI